MNFHRKAIPRIQKLGERIKRTRRKKQISLAKMESLTKIRSRYIEALERGEYDNLPGDIYIKGFLRKIARVLHMDEARLIGLYLTEIRGKPRHLSLDVMKGISEARFVITPKMIFIFLGIAAFLLLGGYLWYQISGFAAAPTLKIAKPVKEDLIVKTDHLIIAGTTDPGTNLTINGQVVPIDLNGQFFEDIKLKNGLNQITLIAANKIGKEISKTIKALAKIPDKNSKIAGTKNKLPLFLIIEIGPSSSWVSIDVDGKRLYQGIMVADTSQEFVAQKEIILTSGNAGSTKVNLNGHDLGILGEEGKMIENVKYDQNTLTSLKKGEYGQKKS
jgi:transcriptional regulator with XRE-family HTH domain